MPVLCPELRGQQRYKQDMRPAWREFTEKQWAVPGRVAFVTCMREGS